MWHVDEGALHAYLDGALDEYPAAEARRVRDHMEVCAECGMRLAEARRLRERAEEILALAVPRVNVPTFEELRAYVSRTRPASSRLSVRLYRLGWAASVVLALGTGWLLRGSDVVPGLTSRSSTLERGASIEEEAGGAAERRTAGSPAGEGAVATGPAEERADPVVGARAREPETPDRGERVADGGRALGAAPGSADDASLGATPRSAEELRPLSAGAPAPAAGGGIGLAAATPQEARSAPAPSPSAVGAGDTAGAAAPPAPSLAAADRAVEVEERQVAEVRSAPAVGLGVTSAIAHGAEPIAPGVRRPQGAVPADGGRGPPDGDDLVSLVVPGLEVLDVLSIGEGSTFSGMRALQRLANGDTLELVHLPGSVSPVLLPPLRTGWSELVRPRGNGWLVMRAPVSERELAELLQRLEAGR